MARRRHERTSVEARRVGDAMHASGSARTGAVAAGGEAPGSACAPPPLTAEGLWYRVWVWAQGEPCGFGLGFGRTCSAASRSLSRESSPKKGTLSARYTESSRSLVSSRIACARARAHHTAVAVAARAWWPRGPGAASGAREPVLAGVVTSKRVVVGGSHSNRRTASNRTRTPRARCAPRRAAGGRAPSRARARRAGRR
eukprot:1240330-Prymnesium_polylepis.1